VPGLTRKSASTSARTAAGKSAGAASGTSGKSSTTARKRVNSSRAASAAAPDPKESIKLLGSVPIFSSLSPRHLKAIAQSMKPIRFPAGHELTHEGDHDARFYLILEGSAKVTVKGRKRGLLGPGDYLGEMAIIDGQPRSATVTAETDVVTLSSAGWNFESVVRKNPAVALSILREMGKRLRSAEASLNA
jgi:CRP/FNR family transcriptional regulator, cyclic AMP receptor protein